MILLYANENFPLPVVKILRNNYGYNLLTTNDVGQSNLSIPDENVLSFAIQEERTILTLNRKDFVKLHNQNSNHYGIVVCSYIKDPNLFAIKIHQSIIQNEPLNGKLIRINRDNS